MCFREMDVYCTCRRNVPAEWCITTFSGLTGSSRPTSPGSTMQTGLPSCTVGSLSMYVCVCVCVCACDYTCVAPVTLPPQQQYIPSILITPSLAFTGLTEFVHVSPSPVCDLLPCYTTWQIHECCCDSLIASNRHKNTSMVAHTHTHRQTQTHY